MAQGNVVGHLDKGALVREMARDIIGQPKPTVFERKKKRGKGSGRLTLTPRAGAAGCLDLTQSEEQFIPDVPNLAYSPLLRGTTADVPVIPKRPRERHVKPVTFQYSREVISHANFLFKTKGQFAMDQYLKEQRIAMTIPGNLEIAEGTQKIQDERKVHEVPGTIGAALAEAQQKADYHRAEAERNSAEAEKYEGVASSLRTAYDLLNAPAAINGGSKRSAAEGERTSRPKGFWEHTIKQIYPGHPLTMKEWRQRAVAVVTDAGGAEYPALAQARKKGLLVDVGNEKYDLRKD